MFDILPLYGTLQPGDTEQVTMTFYGHADIWGQAKAICEVEGGPTYEITLTGEASLVNYKFDCKEIDYGKQVISLCTTLLATFVGGALLFLACLSVRSHKLVVMWLSMNPLDPYVAKWVLVSNHLNQNSHVYFGALGGNVKPLSKKSLKMFGHLGPIL